jgi:predicted GNAT superfamily acetyltransferase
MDYGSPVLAAMFQAYDHMVFEGRPLGSYNSYVYGPVCIGREQRRRGLLRGLYENQKKDLAGRFEVGVAFVARSNPYSLQAHTAGLGMTEVGDFQVKGNSYVILVFRLPSKSSA